MSLFGSIIGGGLSLVGGLLGGSSADKAADAQVQAANAAAQVQRDVATQARLDIRPWQTVGEQALFSLADALGISRPTRAQYLPGQDKGPLALSGADSAPPVTTGQAGGFVSGVDVGELQAERNRLDFFSRLSGGGDRYSGELDRLNRLIGDQEYLSQFQGTAPQSQQDTSGPAMTEGLGFQESPGYQFAFDQGVKAIDRAASARGLLNSGSRLQALTDFGIGTANQEYGSYLNRLAALSGVGQSSTVSSNNVLQGTGANIANAELAAGNARASGYVNKTNAYLQGLQGLGTAAGYAFG